MERERSMMFLKIRDPLYQETSCLQLNNLSSHRPLIVHHGRYQF